MAQSFFALLALVLTVNFAMSVNQWYATFQRATLYREVEEMAQSVAVETMEIVRTRAFDQAIVDGTATGTAADLVLFSDSTEFGISGNATCQAFGGTATCDDLDDFHGQQVLRPFVMGQDTVWFSVDLTVRYVNWNASTGQATPASGKTFYKQVIVKVQDNWGGDLKPFLPTPIQLDRVFAYGF
ncbi:hypothetical protein [Rhodothermus marinus]|uniref:hypothetical protein n=1 Tax=Rhodothermus marinus TaxID=29549 RepID=UPI0006D1A58C|nr:hypothetical protein [Rhodothermus marinus]